MREISLKYKPLFHNSKKWTEMAFTSFLAVNDLFSTIRKNTEKHDNRGKAKKKTFLDMVM